MNLMQISLEAGLVSQVLVLWAEEPNRFSSLICGSGIGILGGVLNRFSSPIYGYYYGAFNRIQVYS